MKVVDIPRVSVLEALSIAAKALSQGKVLVCPTDTIYGLIGDATNAKAVEKIFCIKRRKKEKPLGIFVKDLAMAKKFAKITRKQEAFLKKAWPGKVTAVLQVKKKFPEGVGTQKTIGIRVPKYSFLDLLFEKFHHALAQTSVNISDTPPIKRVKDMVKVFGRRKWKPDLIFDAGILSSSRPSKVIDMTMEKRKILRK
ncbi:MAG: L-threonylcarbamoyladenylate synthase [bacterium]|nr:L-threonylcarbamoyladenylate synthase [bacterium]